MQRSDSSISSGYLILWASGEVFLISMAKIRHNNYIDTVVEISRNASEKGVVDLYTEDDHFTGRHIKVNGQELCHFGTTGYLGLEQDIRIKKAAIDAIMRYGTQFPLSKTFISHSAYSELEEKLAKMYGYPVVVTKNSTLGHLGTIPTVVRDEDAIILDQQVHWSVQNSCQIARTRGIPVEMIKHNNMEMLEAKIKDLSSRADKVWYFADGVYSMYGDEAPIGRLKELSAKYPQLHLYYDDVHGMSWVGKNGTGYVISQYGELPQNVIVFTTLSKTFGASGATMVTANKDFYTRVKRFGGPLTFSAQLEPSSVAAAIASADIHLSDEIYDMQKQLAEKVAFCNECLAKTDLPLIEENNCPVFYIGTGAPAVGYNFVKKLMDAGFYVNMGVFPAVAVKRTGVRFTVSRHNEKEDIKALVDAMARLYPIALAEESTTKNQVRKIFGLPLLKETPPDPLAIPDSLRIEVYERPDELPAGEWDEIFKGRNVFDYAGLQFLEKAFGDSEVPEHQWDFRFVLIRDMTDKIVLATFLTKTLWKDDMLAPASVSMALEKKRITDPHHHSSQVLAMGSLFTEGDHLYLDQEHPDKEAILDLFFQTLTRMDEELQPDVIALRDFTFADDFLKAHCDGQGFVKAALPDSCVMEDLSWSTQDEYLEGLSSKSRKHFRQDIEKYADRVQVEISDVLSAPELEKAYALYRNVWDKNFDMNTFAYPKSIFEVMNTDPNWEFIKMFPAGTEKRPGQMIGVMFSYKNTGTTYVPSLIGLDYDYSEEFSVYRQMLFQTVLRAHALGFKRIDFGFSASFEKRKVGAESIQKIAYIQAKDNFAMEMMEVVQNETTAS